MITDDWVADSGIDVRQLVYGLLTVAKAYKAETVDEDGAVGMLIVDGEDFLRATEPVEAA
jgi:hypothetical protein